MTTTPDPKIVREIDPREELPMLQPVATIYDAYVENEPGWDGEGLYTDLETAKRYSAAEYVLEAWGTDSAGPLTWRFERGFWDLLDDGRATGVIVAPREVSGTKPDEQPQDDGDVRAVRGLTQAASRMLGTWAEANEAVRRELWTTLHDRADDVFDRFRERYAALDAKAPRERVAELAEHAEEQR